MDGLAQDGRYDIAIANPPYIAKEVLDGVLDDEPLQPEVVNYEPGLALDGGVRGLEEINRIALQLGRVLNKSGWLFMEIGADQKEEVLEIFNKNGQYDNLKIYLDFAGLPRVLQARKI
jgi:release factor glutamine methyltransferase